MVSVLGVESSCWNLIHVPHTGVCSEMTTSSELQSWQELMMLDPSPYQPDVKSAANSLNFNDPLFKIQLVAVCVCVCVL